MFTKYQLQFHFLSESHSDFDKLHITVSTGIETRPGSFKFLVPVVFAAYARRYRYSEYREKQSMSNCYNKNNGQPLHPDGEMYSICQINTLVEHFLRTPD